MTVLVLLAAVLVAASSASAANLEAPDLEQRLGTPYRIYCSDELPTSNELGVADIPTGRTWLLAAECGYLRAGPGASGFGQGLLILLHEISHVGWQNGNEGPTECFAIWTLRTIARRAFGATKAQAEAAYQEAWRTHIGTLGIYNNGCLTQQPDTLAAVNGLD